MARIKKLGVNLLSIFSGSFKSHDTLPNEFSDLKAPVRKDYTDFML